ncbi:MAG: divalent-cation tolerance protein CutA [Gemmatimonadaceae bacterium]|nr:divalent-cation tolerance protein CutA [Gemmatimonadaceae bacterium]
MSSGIVSVYVTFATAENAARIGRQMVEERLAACVNVLGPTLSVYRWQGKVEEASEVAALFKTTSGCAELLTKRLAEVHGYENPAVTVWPIEHAPMPYVQWVRAQVR